MTEPYLRSGLVIINPYGGIWTDRIFSDAAEALQYLYSYWGANSDVSKFKLAYAHLRIMKCLKERCFSPIACGGFGYCRERNYWSGKMVKSFDPKCYELAAHFLADEPINGMPTSERARQELAAHIQEEVERWIMYGTWNDAKSSALPQAERS